jgi:hypothetical protein
LRRHTLFEIRVAFYGFPPECKWRESIRACAESVGERTFVVKGIRKLKMRRVLGPFDVSDDGHPLREHEVLFPP